MEEPINDNLIQRFLNKETTEQENVDILSWVSVSEKNRAAFRVAHEVYHLTKVAQFQATIDVDEAWNLLSSCLPKTNVKQKIVYLHIFQKIAATILLVMAIGFGSLWINEHFFTTSKSAFVQFEAPKGEKSKIILADGSLVWLNSETKINYDALKPREVTIDGEGYFEVAKDLVHPFEITTLSGMKVKVTGTKFNLRSFANEAFVETTLDEGGVAISLKDGGRLVQLKPGQQAKYDVKSHELMVQNVSTEIFSIWKNNELRFTNISFAELAPRIERWYGVSINLDSRVGKNDRFTMTIKTESLRELLEMMKLTSKFNYEINGEQVRIYSK